MATVTVTPDQDIIVGEIFIAAPPARVFQALTDPQQMPLWWGQKDLYRITEWQADLRPGGKWSSVGMGADGTAFRIDGEYLEVDPPRLLVYTWVASWKSPAQTVVRWELEPTTVNNLHPNGPRKAGTGTLVKIRHEGFTGEPESARNHGEGWKRALGWLESYLETGQTIDTRK